MKIYLIGMPASGKTFLGRKISKRLNFSWCDLDTKLEKKYKRSITNIVKKDGIELFRKAEQEILKETFSSTKTVFSTGGGCPCFYDNLNQMKLNGIVIFVNTSLQKISSRILRNQDKRFMFKHLNEEEVFTSINTLYEERKKYYEQAHWIIST